MMTKWLSHSSLFPWLAGFGWQAALRSIKLETMVAPLTASRLDSMRPTIHGTDMAQLSLRDILTKPEDPGI